MNAGWSRSVLREFDASARRYDALATLQRAMARRLAEECRRSDVMNGFWVDLGSGTGQLAEALEAIRPGQTVHRVDGSAAGSNIPNPPPPNGLTSATGCRAGRDHQRSWPLVLSCIGCRNRHNS